MLRWLLRDLLAAQMVEDFAKVAHIEQLSADRAAGTGRNRPFTWWLPSRESIRMVRGTL